MTASAGVMGYPGVIDLLPESLGRYFIWALERHLFTSTYLICLLLLIAGNCCRYQTGRKLRKELMQDSLDHLNYGLEEKVSKKTSQLSDCYPTDIQPFRITLFQYFPWPRGLKRVPKNLKRKNWKDTTHDGILLPVTRASKNYQKCNSVFFARRDSPNQARGIASRAFSSRDAILVTGLPLLRGNDQDDSDKIRYYEQKTHSDFDCESFKRYNPRLYYGSVINVDGEPWGSIVVESLHDELTPHEHSFLRTQIAIEEARINKLVKRFDASW